jgi:D-lyxose ketol-isomerase
MAGDWHAFWAKGGDVLIGAVSTVNDDLTDNAFLYPIGRFAEIEEEVPPSRVLVCDYDVWLDA